VPRFFANDPEIPETVITIFHDKEWDLSVPAQLAEYRIVKESSAIAPSRNLISTDQYYYFVEAETERKIKNEDLRARKDIAALTGKLSPEQKRSIVQYISLAKSVVEINYEDFTIDDYCDEFDRLALDHHETVADAMKIGDRDMRTLALMGVHLGLIEMNLQGRYEFRVSSTMVNDLGENLEEVYSYFKKNPIQHIKDAIRRQMSVLLYKDMFDEKTEAVEPAQAETKSRFADMPRAEIVAFVKAKAPKRQVDSMMDAALIKLAIELDI